MAPRDDLSIEINNNKSIHSSIPCIHVRSSHVHSGVHIHDDRSSHQSYVHNHVHSNHSRHRHQHRLQLHGACGQEVLERTETRRKLHHQGVQLLHCHGDHDRVHDNHSRDNHSIHDSSNHSGHRHQQWAQLHASCGHTQDGIRSRWIRIQVP